MKLSTPLFIIILFFLSHYESRLPSLKTMQSPSSSFLQTSAVSEEPCITIYSQCGFQGSTIVLCGSNSTLAQSQFSLQNTMRSIDIPVSVSVTVYELVNFGGRSETFDSSVNCIDLSVQPISSLQISRVQCAFVYSECNYKNLLGIVCNQQSEMPQTLSNQIASIKVAKGYSVQIFDESLFKGESYVLSENLNCLTEINFSKRISSMRIVTECVISYHPGLCSDEEEELETGITGENSLWCDSYEQMDIKNANGEFKLPGYINVKGEGMGSLVIPDEVNMILYSGKKYEGTSYFLDEPIYDCRNEKQKDVKWFNQKFKSFKIFKSNLCVEFFSECNFVSSLGTKCGNVRWIGYQISQNVKSIKILNEAKFTIFSDMFFKGNQTTFYKDVQCLKNENWLTDVRSISIKRANCVTFWDQCNYQGQSVKICKDNEVLPFKAKSIQIPDGIEIEGYNKPNFKGLKYEINKSIPCLDQI